MVKIYFLRNRCNALSAPQLQSRLPGASQHHSCFAARSRANVFCHSRLQTRIAQEHRTRSTNVCAASARTRPHKSGAAPSVPGFCDFFLWNRVPTTVSCTFCQRHLPKAPRACQYHFEVQTELSPQSCTLFVGNFPRSNYEPAETLLRRPQRPRYPEKRGFVLESVFAREFTHFRTVTLPSCLMVGGWHGDVVDMMMGLTWWCGWHNGGNANQDHRPVTRKIFS